MDIKENKIPKNIKVGFEICISLFDFFIFRC